MGLNLIPDFRFLEMTQCMIEQYSNFTIKELNNQPVDGKLSLVKIPDSWFIQLAGRKHCGQRRAQDGLPSLEVEVWFWAFSSSSVGLFDSTPALLGLQHSDYCNTSFSMHVGSPHWGCRCAPSCALIGALIYIYCKGQHLLFVCCMSTSDGSVASRVSAVLAWVNNVHRTFNKWLPETRSGAWHINSSQSFPGILCTEALQ